MREFRCPACGMQRWAPITPRHKHDGEWVVFVPVIALKPKPSQKPRRR